MFKIGDEVYIIEDRQGYRAEIIAIHTYQKRTTYDLIKYVPGGLFKEDEYNRTVESTDLFLSKKGCKEKLKEIEKADALVKDYPKEDNDSWTKRVYADFGATAYR